MTYWKVIKTIENKKDLFPLFGSISKSIIATSDSFCLITPHIVDLDPVVYSFDLYFNLPTIIAQLYIRDTQKKAVQHYNQQKFIGQLYK